MEFFIAGGDAAEGFEAYKEVLNTVALAIERAVAGSVAGGPQQGQAENGWAHSRDRPTAGTG